VDDGLRSKEAAERGGPAARRLDLAMAIALTLGTAFWGDLLASGPRRPDYAASVITSIALMMPLAIRRTHPILMTGLMTVAGLVQVVFVSSPTWSLIAIPAASYSVARFVAGHESRIVVGAGALGSVIGPLRWMSDEPLAQQGEGLLSLTAPFSALCFAWVVIPYLLGRRDRETAITREEREQSARQRYESELVRREQQTRMAEARIRNEIARELHDVVAHSLSVIIVQADGGKALARKQPEAATRVLDTISDTGREALSEMRRIVGVLRVDPESSSPDDYRPNPGLPDIATMVARAGDRVTLSITGAEPAVSATVGLTAYRVVQEALTNFLTHAGPQARARVTIIYEPTVIHIEVMDDGGIPAGSTPDAADDWPLVPDLGPGYGLRGMHERVAAMGGKLVARPTRTGGWLVRATLPLQAGKPSPRHHGPGGNQTP